MLCGKVITVFALRALALAYGMPENSDSGSQDTSAGLPFIQLTNGGVRFNFGGYHAEAGLGGLLGGSQTGGGLHASAGTPWGGHAAAGLGGLLGGDNANAGGGLYARAGLGNGRHEAAAGLGGLLDGSGRSNAPVSGGLFARAGSRGVGLSSEVASSGSTASGQSGENGRNGAQNGEEGDGGKANGGRTNIQIIARKEQQKVKQVVTRETTTETAKQTDQTANEQVRDTQSPEAIPVASGAIFGSVFANPAPRAPISIEKVKIIDGAIESVPPVPPLPNEANEINDNRPHGGRIVRPIVRKRFWGPRKKVVVDYVPLEAQRSGHWNIEKRQATVYQADQASASGNKVPLQPNPNSGFFDDIFKIPISTLNAVNQLLNNNSG